MNLPIKIALFLLGNTIGYFMTGLLLVLIITTKVIDISALDFDFTAFGHWFSPRVMLAWLVCGVFSISGFFIGGYWRYVFFAAPAIIPFFYGLALIASV